MILLVSTVKQRAASLTVKPINEWNTFSRKNFNNFIKSNKSSLSAVPRICGKSSRLELAPNGQHIPSFNYSLQRERSRITSKKSVISFIHSRTLTQLATSSTATDSDVITVNDNSQVKGIAWLRQVLVETLNELYDPADIARGSVRAKFEKGTKKKKNNKSTDEESIVDSPTVEEIERMAEDAAIQANSQFTAQDAMVTPATKPEFGDYQCNAAMGLAKSLGMKPRDCALQIVEKLKPKLVGIMDEPEIAGPGFINLKFSTDYLSSTVFAMAQDVNGRLAVPKSNPIQKVVVDFSSPNIAKEMHVGHLRSTIIGDTLSNILEFAGHEVTRLNHIGDWGTQFGMLVEHLRDNYPEALSKETSQNVDLGDLVMLYKAAKQRFDSDDEFKVRAREGVVKLQSGDSESLAAWDSLCAASRKEYQKIYDMLNIQNLQERGESFYNPYLKDIITELEEKQLAVESEGATVVFLEGVSSSGSFMEKHLHIFFTLNSPLCLVRES